MKYRRAIATGGTYFFTVVTYNRCYHHRGDPWLEERYSDS